MSSAVERFRAYGHPNVTATHRSTFEITAEEDLTQAGSCIIAVRSEKGAADLSREFSELLRVPGSQLETVLMCGGVIVTIRSSASPACTLDHQTDLVWRRSAFTCGRTIGIYSDYTAALLPREMITWLQHEEPLDVQLTVFSDLHAKARSAEPTASFIFMNEE
jgi:hypothetical protein